MEVIANNLSELDLYIFIVATRELSENEAKYIEDAAEAWSIVAFSGAFDGPLHHYEQPEYEKEKESIIFHVDVGSMNPMDGFELLKSICEGLNKYTFREEVISHIELNGIYEEL